MERFSGESREPEVTRDNKMVINGKEVAYRLLFLGSLALGTSGGCTEVRIVEAEEDVENSSSVGSSEVDILEELLEEEFAEEEDVVIVFLDPSEGSGLDEEGFALEENEFVEEEQAPEIEEEEILVEKGEAVVEEEVGNTEEEQEAPVETETEEVEDIQIPQEVQEILSLEQELSFDDEGQLFFKNEEGEEVPILTFETERHLVYPYEPVKEVKFFVIHYDGAPQTFMSGEYRTVFNTLNGLNREGNPSVQFCVDTYPITDELVDGQGLGAIHSQKTNAVPYKGRHVQIGIELSTGREDINRIKTARMYEELGVGSNYVDFVDSGNKDFDSYSLGVEQVGTNYSINFPEQFPPRQQIANILALTKAVSFEYDLSVWDIIAHREIQEKSDPGEEYMLTLRYLLGVEYMLDESDFPENFLETENPYEYFVKLREYGIMRMGEERYRNWNNIYEMDNILSEGEIRDEFSNRNTDQEISSEEIEFLVNHEISFGDTERQVAMMTYDDGGREEYMEHIMGVYEKYSLRATFFVTGQWVERNPELVKDMIERGFEIGCHSWDHAEMTALPRDEARKQIEDFLQAMEEVDSSYEVRLIRFPYGSRTQDLKEIAAEFGLQSIMWSYGSGGMDDTTFDNVMRHLDWGSIILSHSTRYYDVYEAERILESLLEQGYDIVTVTEGMAQEDMYGKE